MKLAPSLGPTLPASKPLSLLGGKFNLSESLTFSAPKYDFWEQLRIQCERFPSLHASQALANFLVGKRPTCLRWPAETGVSLWRHSDGGVWGSWSPSGASSKWELTPKQRQHLTSYGSRPNFKRACHVGKYLITIFHWSWSLWAAAAVASSLRTK